MTIDIDPVITHVGPLALTWYGLFVALAIFAGLFVALREARRKGLRMDEVESLAIWVVLGGFIGARSFHVIDRWDDYSWRPLAVFAIWNGGLAILGAVFGGMAAGVIAAWRRGLPVRILADAAAPGVILGQAIGRFACLFTGDAVGRPTTGFGITYLDPHAMAPQLGVAYEPVFLYEMLLDFGIFALLWRLRSRPRADGQLFAIYLALYAIGKFALTFRRTEVVWLAGLQEAQLLSAAALALAATWAWSSARAVRS